MGAVGGMKSTDLNSTSPSALKWEKARGSAELCKNECQSVLQAGGCLPGIHTSCTSYRSERPVYDLDNSSQHVRRLPASLQRCRDTTLPFLTEASS